MIVGNYEVKAAKAGFQTQIVKQVRLMVGSTVVVDASLSIGAEVTTITVDAAASQVDTTTSQISAQIGRGQMENGNGIPNTTAGQITNIVGTSRQLQFALKFRF